LFSAVSDGDAALPKILWEDLYSDVLAIIIVPNVIGVSMPLHNEYGL